MKSFLLPEIQEGALITLSEKESRHALLSLRLEEKEKVSLLDGKGKTALGEIVSVAGGLVQVKILSVQARARTRAKITLLQAQLKGPKMDWLVEKITELGIDTLQVMHTQFTVAQSEKVDRWLRLAEAAMKQSGNPNAPHIPAPQSLASILASLPKENTKKILLSPKASQSLLQSLKNEPNFSELFLAIGPEGGFSSEEIQQLERAGFESALLSENILRGETAAISAAAIAIHAIAF